MRESLHLGRCEARASGAATGGRGDAFQPPSSDAYLAAEPRIPRVRVPARCAPAPVVSLRLYDMAGGGANLDALGMEAVQLF